MCHHFEIMKLQGIKGGVIPFSGALKVGDFL